MKIVISRKHKKTTWETMRAGECALHEGSGTVYIKLHNGSGANLNTGHYVESTSSFNAATLIKVDAKVVVE